MRRKIIVSCLLVPFLTLVATMGTTYAQQMAVERTYTFTCQGTKGTCFSTRDGGGIIHTIAGDLVDMGSSDNPVVCTEGGVSIGNIFLHTPGNAATGIGYTGITGCANQTDRNATVRTGQTTQVYHTIEEWQQAVSGSTMN